MLPAEISLIISAPSATHLLAVSDQKVSIDNVMLGNVFFNNLTTGINIFNSLSDVICFAPGLDDCAPISIIVAPSSSIFLA